MEVITSVPALGNTSNYRRVGGKTEAVEVQTCALALANTSNHRPRPRPLAAPGPPGPPRPPAPGPPPTIGGKTEQHARRYHHARSLRSRGPQLDGIRHRRRRPRPGRARRAGQLAAGPARAGRHPCSADRAGAALLGPLRARAPPGRRPARRGRQRADAAVGARPGRHRTAGHRNATWCRSCTTRGSCTSCSTSRRLRSSTTRTGATGSTWTSSVVTWTPASSRCSTTMAAMVATTTLSHDERSVALVIYSLRPNGTFVSLVSCADNSLNMS